MLAPLATLSAPDIGLTGGPWNSTIDAGDLEAGAGSEFNSPVAIDVLVSTLAISGTGGGNWNVKVSLTGEGAEWLSGVSIAVKRGGDSDDNDISGGLTYRVLTSSPEVFFSGTGDYESIEILLRVEGFDIHARPDEYNLGIRYTIEPSA